MWVSTKVKNKLDKRMLRSLRAMARMRGEDPARVRLDPWANHDLRRTLRSGLSRLRVDHDVKEAVLAHVKPGIIGTYVVPIFSTKNATRSNGGALTSVTLVTPAPNNVIKFADGEGVMHSPDSIARGDPVTAAEVERWFKRGHKPRAERRTLRQNRRAPEQDAMAGRSAAAACNRRRRVVGGRFLRSGQSQSAVAARATVKSWNYKEAAEAAKTLLDDIPAMLWHWHFETIPGQKPNRS